MPSKFVSSLSIYCGLPSFHFLIRPWDACNYSNSVCPNIPVLIQSPWMFFNYGDCDISTIFQQKTSLFPEHRNCACQCSWCNVFMCRLLPHNLRFSALGDRLHVPDCAVAWLFYKRDHTVETDRSGTAWERVKRSQRLTESTCVSHIYPPLAPQCLHWLFFLRAFLPQPLSSSDSPPPPDGSWRRGTFTQEMWISSQVASSLPVGPFTAGGTKSKTHMASRVRISFQHHQSRESLSVPNYPCAFHSLKFRPLRPLRLPRVLGPKIGHARSPYHTMASDISSTQMLFVPIAQTWILTTSAVSSKLPIC